MHEESLLCLATSPSAILPLQKGSSTLKLGLTSYQVKTVSQLMSWCKAAQCFPSISQEGTQPTRFTFLCSTGDASSEAGGHIGTVVLCCVQAGSYWLVLLWMCSKYLNQLCRGEVLDTSLHGAVQKRDFRPKSCPAARMPMKQLTMGKQCDHG